jgi:hypothetical protein
MKKILFVLILVMMFASCTQRVVKRTTTDLVVISIELNDNSNASNTYYRVKVGPKGYGSYIICNYKEIPEWAVAGSVVTFVVK